MPLPTLTPRTVVLGVVAAVWAGATIGLTQHALSAPAAPDVPRAAAPATPQQPAPAPRRPVVDGSSGGPGAAAPTRVTHLRPVGSPAAARPSASPTASPAASAVAAAPTASPTPADASPTPDPAASPSPGPSTSTQPSPTPPAKGSNGHRLR